MEDWILLYPVFQPSPFFRTIYKNVLWRHVRNPQLLTNLNQIRVSDDGKTAVFLGLSVGGFHNGGVGRYIAIEFVGNFA